ncbi:hypothetical protein DPX16_5191 [Anabarilius grahami]|uniref:Uncharacterized protein n=1 Tax=Anabarilius grahami TaxID=495550 RepID=A0A3N0XL63_ANAGA|nr:hypothetical protein DPX16_5191 [Anabarilius grahami]
MTQALTVGALTVPRDEAPVQHVGGRKSNQTFSPSQWTHSSYGPACEGQEECVECWAGDDDDVWRRGRETDTLHAAPVPEGRVTSLAQGHRRNVCLASEAGPHRWTPADGQLRAGLN